MRGYPGYPVDQATLQAMPIVVEIVYDVIRKNDGTNQTVPDRLSSPDFTENQYTKPNLFEALGFKEIDLYELNILKVILSFRKAGYSVCRQTIAYSPIDFDGKMAKLVETKERLTFTLNG